MNEVKIDSATLPTRRSSSSNFEERNSNCSDDYVYANCRMEELPCFHESITRNVAEIFLLNAEVSPGSFLIRPSHERGNYSVSVRVANSVKHFQINYNGTWYSFGRTQFWSPLEIWKHLQKSPVLECEGVRVHLLQPYYNENRTRVPLPEVDYSTIERHYIPEKPPPVRRTSSNIVTSLEGALYKKKAGKAWKCRWCILKKNYLSYKKDEKTKKTLKTLDLSQANDVHEDNSEPSKQNCFRIVFSKTSYLFSSDSLEDKEIWFKNIKWQIEESSLNHKT